MGTNEIEKVIRYKGQQWPAEYFSEKERVQYTDALRRECSRLTYIDFIGGCRTLPGNLQQAAYEEWLRSTDFDAPSDEILEIASRQFDVVRLLAVLVTTHDCATHDNFLALYDQLIRFVSRPKNRAPASSDIPPDTERFPGGDPFPAMAAELRARPSPFPQ